MNKKIGMVSLGCAKNRVDAEMLLYSLKQAGFVFEEDPSFADAVIVNTCGFIESAKKESIEEILELAKLKQENRIKAIIVTGCLAERYREEIMKELPEVDAVLGIGSNEEICKAVETALNKEKFIKFDDKLKLPLNGKRIQSTPKHYAYLKVADGCDNCCTYCAIPLIRGSFRSRKMENILLEAEELAQNGVKELLVIAQDTTRYGEDIYGELKLSELLKKLCKIDGIHWVRVLYCYPDRITDELLDTIAKEDKIVKYLDIPLQHCNERILLQMNRRGSSKTLMALMEKIRSKIKNVVIRTTFIAGFPGETVQEFEELAQFEKDAKFERLGCFAYSQEEDTKAAALGRQIDEETKENRIAVIMEQQQQIMDDFHNSLIGKKLEVLVEGYDKFISCYFGRSYMDAPEVDCVIFFGSNKEIATGGFANVEVTEIIDGEIFGTGV